MFFYFLKKEMCITQFLLQNSLLLKYVCVQRLRVSFFPFSAHSLFLDLTFLHELGKKKIKQQKFPGGAQKKGVAEHQFLRKTWSDLSPSSSPHEMIPSNLACDHILDPSAPQ